MHREKLGNLLDMENMSDCFPPSSPSLTPFAGWDSISKTPHACVGGELEAGAVLLTRVMTLAGRWDREAMASLAPGMCQDTSSAPHQSGLSCGSANCLLGRSQLETSSSCAAAGITRKSPRTPLSDLQGVNTINERSPR